MRPVHLLGIGFVVGTVALGAMLAVMTLRWQESAYPGAGPAVASAAGTGATSGSPETVKGKAIFDQKCAACHTVGGGRKAGPDLKGVADKRPRDWLVRMIVEPDKLIASGDATVQQLVREYGMPMPNVGVSQQDAEAILAFLAQ
ncbi:MAG: c-type cytochrome [Sphingomonadaceae bacterium]